MKVNTKSAWSEKEILQYFNEAAIPMRISCHDSDGYPLICSVWFVFFDGFLWAASHKNSHIIKTLKNNSKVAFEIASNDYPYHGVRGKADITLLASDPQNVLDKVIDKYLKDSNSKLASWLKSRKQDEYAIKLSAISVNSWDFSDRMERQ